jgi:hypothetical protein
VVYGRLADREALSRKYPEGFVAGGCYVESVEDPGPDRSCRRCGRRFRSGGSPAEIWLGRVVRGRPPALSPQACVELHAALAPPSTAERLGLPTDDPGRAIRAIFAQPDAGHVQDQLEVIAGMLGRQFPKLERMLRDSAEDLLAFTAFPVGHWKKIWSAGLAPGERVGGQHAGGRVEPAPGSLRPQGPAGRR